MRTGRLERERDLCDGAGICSPGRWPPWSRPVSNGWRVLAVRGALRRAVLQLDVTSEKGLKGVFAELAAGRLTQSPFREEAKAELAEYIMTLFDDDGAQGARPRRGDLDQPVRVRLLQALQRAVGDPDGLAMDEFARGIRLGV